MGVQSEQQKLMLGGKRTRRGEGGRGETTGGTRGDAEGEVEEEVAAATWSH